MRRKPWLLGIVSVLPAATVLCSPAVVFDREQSASPQALHAYHDSPSTAPLPATLDASEFRENRNAFVAYSLAARIEPTLYQVPCYCGCDKDEGHKSLLDCFTGKHGTHCHTCQKEVVFCFLENRKGKSPAQIREAMAQGKVAKFDLDKYVQRFWSELQRPVP